MILIVLAILAILLLIALALICSHKKSGLATLECLFNNTTTNLDNVGGFLVNNFGSVWFERMLKLGEVSLADTAVCAGINRHTCTAYSFIRKDLIPMFFMFPGEALNVPCGIILDTKKIWPLITLMATIDGDTNNRSCCTNESYSPILTRSPFSGNSNDLCVYNTLIEKAKTNPNYQKYVNGKYATYINGPDPQVATNGGLDRSLVERGEYKSVDDEFVP